MSRLRMSSPGSIVILLLVIALAIICIYSAIQLHLGKQVGVYPTPEESLYALVARDYRGVKRVEIARMDRKVFDHLRFVKAYVYAESRSDGSELSGRGYDEEGRFFVRVKDGWTFVPKDRFPKVIALSQWLFRRLG